MFCASKFLAIIRMLILIRQRKFKILVSGEIPEEGVVSKRSGLLFEKRLIGKHLSGSNTCPVTGVEMAIDDLIEVKCIFTLSK